MVSRRFVVSRSNLQIDLTARIDSHTLYVLRTLVIALCEDGINPASGIPECVRSQRA
jgi:hypothetical protein